MVATSTLPAHRETSESKTSDTVSACVSTFGYVTADMAKIDSLRREPGDLQGRELPASFLKHADEQSVCGFAAVLQAIRAAGSPVDAYREWGVIAAAKFVGRSQCGATIARFFDQGVRGVSPHAIPQISLHSLSGVISVGLGIGGPNLGAGGGMKAIPDGLLTAATMWAEGRLPGLWLLLTEWDTEPLPQKNGRTVADGVCHALAMALVPGEGVPSGVRLQISVQPFRTSNGDVPIAACESTVAALARALEAGQQVAADGPLWKLSLDWGAELLLSRFTKRSS
jgi:hypothetical protein